nr:SDR family oxidoreductase [Peribacillus simplex]
MGHIHFFTGFPGFISNQLIRELVRRDERINKIYLLVLPQQRAKAEKETKRIEDEWDGMKIAFEIVTGDITKEHLGFSLEVSMNFSNKSRNFSILPRYTIWLSRKNWPGLSM